MRHAGCNCSLGEHQSAPLPRASVVLLPSVVLAGIMGMNFKVGLFEDPNLFWVVIGVMLTMAAAALGIARWRGWL